MATAFSTRGTKNVCAVQLSRARFVAIACRTLRPHKAVVPEMDHVATCGWWDAMGTYATRSPKTLDGGGKSHKIRNGSIEMGRKSCLDENWGFRKPSDTSMIMGFTPEMGGIKPLFLSRHPVGPGDLQTSSRGRRLVWQEETVPEQRQLRNMGVVKATPKMDEL